MTGLAKQLAPWRYLFARRPALPGPSGDGYTFYLHRHPNEKTMVIAILLIVAIEAPLVHLLLASWNHTAAWVVTGLTVLTVLWVLGFVRAGRLRPSFIDSERLRLVDGLSEVIEVPMESIASSRVSTVGGPTVRTGSSAPDAESGDASATVRAAQGVTRIELGFDQPLPLRRFAGGSESVSSYTFEVSDANAVARLSERLSSEQRIRHAGHCEQYRHTAA